VRLCGFTLGIVNTGVEAAVPTGPENHITAANLTLKVSDYQLFFLFYGRLTILAERLGVLTFGIIGTCGELTEPAVLNDHLTSALITDYVCFLCGHLNALHF